jgi:glycerophosphoryl diester phosphodiesterase
LAERIGPGCAETASALGCVSLHCNCEYLTQAQVDEIRASGYWLLCYTVNDPDSARRLFSWGVDAIFTDRPDLIGRDFA